MKWSNFGLFFAAALIGITADELFAQGLNVLTSFNLGVSGVNQPSSELVLLGNTLFGITYSGGTNGHGTIFSIKTDGSDYNLLYAFTADADGSHPRGHLEKLFHDHSS